MLVTSRTYSRSLCVALPRDIHPAMVDISCLKGERLSVVADAWHAEQSCHYRWQIQFAPNDVDMVSIIAPFGHDHTLLINADQKSRYGFSLTSCITHSLLYNERIFHLVKVRCP
ncbi:hypothetical protein CONPUDRAFT_62045 [Coniophora puteana RWD-64-598 SS2]|uniref:Uncharacterized protein n=1 Tax=Coniophora puteana (strain RWD-64-598) TaxID=741705 RepID=A0A5M3MFK9_CONPW|nr:uncharacterized protein CONPUDRAFT_62045 [Coniophora puteana RWD-64-598 SS2]EIW77564.1 hypothetical protein CONPUDRAFT_62045 [Coniophora puteana RWD-64-598 SS2]